MIDPETPAETDEFSKWHQFSAPEDRIEAAIELAVRWGRTDGSHHKAWVIDKMVRILAGDRYEEIVKEAKDGEDGPDTYEWDVGIAP